MATRGWENATPTDTKSRRQDATMPQKRRSKYGAVKTTVDNITFHSAAEAKRYGQLKLFLKLGTIERLILQPVYRIYAYPIGGDPVQVAKYVGDFQYETADGRRVVEDVKGMKTPVYRLKKKLVEAQYRLVIQEIT